MKKMKKMRKENHKKKNQVIKLKIKYKKINYSIKSLKKMKSQQIMY